MRGLNGKRFVIAGGASGIGAATAERLAAEGAAVVVGDINLDGAQATAKRIADAGGTALAVEFDLADEQSVRALVDTAVDQLGGVDGLYNVGADVSAEVLGRDGNLLDMDPAVWRRTLEVNLIGYALTARAVLPLLLEQGSGAIVNTSSASAHVGDRKRAAYSASKAGINALTRHIASRWGKQGIRCNCVSPGVVMTEAARRTSLNAKNIAIAQQAMPSPSVRQAQRPRRGGRVPALRRRRMDQRPGLVDLRRRTAPRMKTEHTGRLPTHEAARHARPPVDSLPNCMRGGSAVLVASWAVGHRANFFALAAGCRRARTCPSGRRQLTASPGSPAADVAVRGCGRRAAMRCGLGWAAAVRVCRRRGRDLNPGGCGHHIC